MNHYVYILKNNNTGRSYEVHSAIKHSLQFVWMSQCGWFGKGANVTISDEDGNSETFTKTR